MKLEHFLEALKLSSNTNPNSLCKSLLREQFPEEAEKLKDYDFTRPELSEFGLVPKTSKQKLDDLRNQLKQVGVDGYILSTNDEFISEYTPLFAKRLFYLTGFSGSYGFAVILANKAAIFVDGRYIEQAACEVDTEFLEIIALSQENIAKFIVSNLKEGSTIALNANTNSCSMVSFFKNKLQAKGIKLKALTKDLVDNIWKNQPFKPLSAIYEYSEEFAGESNRNKIDKLANKLSRHKLDALLITALDDVAWTLNLRANDIDCSPFFLGQIIVFASGEVALFVQLSALLVKTKEFLKDNNVKVYNLDDLPSYLQQLKLGKVALHKEAPYVYYSLLADKCTLLENSWVAELKTIKNNVEIEHTKQAHRQDGAMLTKLILWIKEQNNNAKAGEINETDISNKLEEIKSTNSNYQGPSFDSIVAIGANGAFPHYHTTPETNTTLTKDTTILIDCGSQYFSGTTDVTRSWSVATPTADYRKAFSLVFKGLVALSKAKFPEGTLGCNLDTLARQFLWQQGRDYNHGTGHGVGHFLSVHEGPVRISQTGKEPLAPGMVLSIEPGFYWVNHFGIRLENLVVVEKAEQKGFLQFHTLTLCPIDINSLDLNLITPEELEWLKDYHATIKKHLAEFLTIDEQQALAKYIGD